MVPTQGHKKLSMNTAPALGFVIALSTQTFGVSATPSHPILDFNPYDELRPNLLVMTGVVHAVIFNASTFSVTSVWTIENPEAAKGELLVGTDGADGAQLTKVSIDGKDVPLMPLAGNYHYVRILLPNLLKKECLTVSIASVLSTNASLENLRILPIYALPKPARLVNKGGIVGWDLREMSRHSYGDPVDTSMKIRLPPNWLVAGSSQAHLNSSDGTRIFEFDPIYASRFVLIVAHTNFWKQESCSLERLDCILMSRMKNPILSKEIMHDLLAAVAAQFGARFGPPNDHIVMVDSDLDAISGGLLGNNVLGFFAKAKISPEEQADFKRNFGWPQQSSTKAYVSKLYTAAKDPWRDYLTGMLAHEFAHLYFGFGKTTERIGELHQLWFSLGMGLVYDEIVTKALTGRRDAFFEAVETNWKQKFSDNQAIDQNLIRPNTSRDKEFHLSRAHVFAHGKALAVLRALREHVGSAVFDRATASYLDQVCTNVPCIKAGEFGGYLEFRKKLQETAPKLSEYERLAGLERPVVSTGKR